jgi:hypothetical protein
MASAIVFAWMVADTAAEPVRRLSVAGVNLSLGMSFDAVSEKLQQTRFGLQAVDAAGTVFAIVATDGPPFESPGNLTFKAGRLWWIGKSWGNYFGPDAKALFHSLFSILSKTGDNRVTAVVKSEVIREPNLTRHEVRIELPDNRVLSISMNRSKQSGQNVYVRESIGGY